MTDIVDVDSFQGEPNLENPVAGEAVFARGEPAEHPFAVLYQGEWETPWDGTCTAVRLHARALAQSGLPVVLRSFSHVVINEDGVAEPVHADGVPFAVRVEVGSLTDTSAATMTPMIKHVVIRSADQLRAIVYPRGIMHHELGFLIAMRKAVAGATILYTVWERDRVDPEIAKILNRVAQVWVPCEQNRQMLLKCGVERVVTVPHPFDPLSPLLKLTARRPYPNRRFYAIGRWEPRKGYHELLGAFLRSFRPEQGHTLTIKFSGGQWDGYPTPAESVAHWAKHPDVIERGWTNQAFRKSVLLIPGKVTQDAIVKLHFLNNIYVACSHGEAWNLPARDAKLAGNLLVHVPYGGTEDFSESRDIKIPFHMAPVPPSYHWEPGAEWADFDTDAIGAALEQAGPPIVFERPTWFEDRFSLASIGTFMRRLVLGVTVPDAAAYYGSK